MICYKDLRLFLWKNLKWNDWLFSSNDVLTTKSNDNHQHHQSYNHVDNIICKCYDEKLPKHDSSTQEYLIFYSNSCNEHLS